MESNHWKKVLQTLALPLGYAAILEYFRTALIVPVTYDFTALRWEETFRSAR
jgi:hypothetical protein